MSSNFVVSPEPRRQQVAFNNLDETRATMRSIVPSTSSTTLTTREPDLDLNLNLNLNLDLAPVFRYA
ncbi:hypothetical protein E0Z10_g8148 [Xylaria hypoxylon]|uniref:Uncharacterized protein n=1 Tax=Xylaria hypoxylon TaxID=37992 RepID=A0A4Z0Y9V5_9PEZI|nr:hypothetical protein E0Z10_g8148 [Xylaria hypoxylon]